MTYTAFNQGGKAIASGYSLVCLINTMVTAGFKFYFIANESNKVLVNELKGRALPKRTSRGTVTL